MKSTIVIMLLLCSVAAPAYTQSRLRLKERSSDTRTYTGQVRLSGKFATYFDGSDFDGQLSFTEDKASRRKLPSNGWREGLIMLRPPRDEMDILRMFSIPSTRDNKVCGYEGRATIDIRDFTAVKAGSETGDAAWLVRVVSKTKPKRVPCRNVSR